MIRIHRDFSAKIRIAWDKAEREYVARISRWPHVKGQDRTVEGALLCLSIKIQEEAEQAILEGSNV